MTDVTAAAQDVVASLSPAVRRRLLRGPLVDKPGEPPAMVPAYAIRALIRAVEGT